MYKARFSWNQETSFPIYQELLKPIVESSQGGLNSSFEFAEASEKYTLIDLDLDITEDFTYEIKSNYQNYGDILSGIPYVGSLMGYMETMGTMSGLGGVSSNTSEWLKFQVWKETEPFKMNFKFVLSNYSDPFIDVYAPAMALSSMSILSPVQKDTNFTFYTPGVNSSAISGLKRVDDKGKETNAANSTSGGTLALTGDKSGASRSIESLIKSSSKIIREFIIWSPKVDGGTKYKESGKFDTVVPGVPLLKVKNCFIESAKPTWSKDRTASGIPIWCELELGIQSIYSANDSMFSYLTKTPNYTGGLDATKKIATNIFR